MKNQLVPFVNSETKMQSDVFFYFLKFGLKNLSCIDVMVCFEVMLFFGYFLSLNLKTQLVFYVNSETIVKVTLFFI